MNRDLVTSIIRTWCAAVLGALATWLAKRGVDLDVETSTIIVTTVVTGALYAVVRAVESRWPIVGVLLGIRKAPLYTPPTPPVITNGAPALPEGTVLASATGNVVWRNGRWEPLEPSGGGTPIVIPPPPNPTA